MEAVTESSSVSVCSMPSSYKPMSVERTREMLGQEVSDFSDEEVQQLIDDMRRVCGYALETITHQIKNRKLRV